MTALRLFLLAIFTCLVKSQEEETTAVWTFRENNEQNALVKATYKGGSFSEPIKDFTICFRYQVLFFSRGNHGMNIFSAENNGELIVLRLFNDKWANKFEMQTKSGQRQVIWFDAEVPVRQWNSICLSRDFARQKFRVHQNGVEAFSYGECKTLGETRDFSVANAQCAPGNWTLKNGERVDFVGPCTKKNWLHYWCMVNESKIYDATTSYWGQCSLSCTDTSYERENNPLTTHAIDPKLFDALTIGAEAEGGRISLKGKIADFFMWTKSLESSVINQFMHCEAIDYQSADMSWTNWRNEWALDGLNGNSLVESTSIRNHLCRRETYRIYIGFSEVMVYEKAMKHCSAFGGRLPMSDE